MKPAYELPRFRGTTSSLAAYTRREARFEWNWHYHPEMELTWIRQGFGKRLVGDHVEAYKSGDLVLLGSNLPHTWASATNALRNEAIVIQFLPQMLPEALLKLPEFAGISEMLSRAGCGLRFSRKQGEVLEREFIALTAEKGIAAWLRLVKILHALASDKVPESLASTRYRHQKSYRLNSRVERVTAYIEKHFREEITLPQAAKLCGLTPEACSRFFRKMTGRTFVDFRNSFRIREACRLLSETDLSITETAYECGFDNLSNFNRRFLEACHIPPREYRRMYRAVL